MAKTYEKGQKEIKVAISQEHHQQGIYPSGDEKHDMNEYYEPRSVKSNQLNHIKIT